MSGKGGALIGLYGQPEARERVLREALDLPVRIEAARRRAAERCDAEGQALAERYRRTAGTLCHNLACELMWRDRSEDAVPLFERALFYREDPLTRFFYAGALMEVHGDRGAALASLRRAAADPRSSLVHRFEKAFRENLSFAPVHNDPEFLAVVRHGAERYKTVGDAGKI